jgi:Uma2 family endonuclease
MNARQEWLLEQWDAACRDPALAQLPHKVELNEWGKVELTPPAPPIRGSYSFHIAKLLERSLGGEASVECPVLTVIGVRVPDVVWVTAERRAELRSARPLVVAPEICVEVLSADNTEEEMQKKTQAYLEAGARKVILVDPGTRRARFFRSEGEAARSGCPIEFHVLFAADH